MSSPAKTPTISPVAGNDGEIPELTLDNTTVEAAPSPTPSTEAITAWLNQDGEDDTTTVASPSPRQRTAAQTERSDSRRFGVAFNAHGHPISLHVYTGQPPAPSQPMPPAGQPIPPPTQPMLPVTQQTSLIAQPVPAPVQPMPVPAQPLALMQYSNVNWPPYNPVGRLAHEQPARLTRYKTTNSLIARMIIERDAFQHFRHNVPSAQKFKRRGHAESPTAYTFCEHRESVTLTIDEATVAGREPIVSRTVRCVQDGVIGLHIEWRSKVDAEFFLYHYKINRILQQSPHNADTLLPPRFVEPYTNSRYSNILNPDLGTLAPPPRHYGNRAGDPRTRPTSSNNGSGGSGSQDTSPALDGPSACRQHTNAGSTAGLQLVARRQLTSTRGGPNQISPEKINAGRDVRTTVMVRGIPRQVTYSDLKALVDQICPGRYDFVYLRANFTTGMNVGYAFVNFVDCLVLLHFYRVMHGLPMPGWENDAEPGTIEMVYADCQGLDSMLDRFRNSAIMQGAYDHRPHAYYTVNDGNDGSGNPLVGQEQAFPPPNNLTRLDRSIARTQAEGLFTGSAKRGRGGSRARVQVRDRSNGGVAHVSAGTANASVSNDLEFKLAHYKHHPRNAELLALIENAGY